MLKLNPAQPHAPIGLMPSRHPPKIVRHLGAGASLSSAGFTEWSPGLFAHSDRGVTAEVLWFPMPLWDLGGFRFQLCQDCQEF